VCFYCIKGVFFEGFNVFYRLHNFFLNSFSVCMCYAQGQPKRIEFRIRADSCCYTCQCIFLRRAPTGGRGSVQLFLEFKKESRYRIVLECFFFM